MQQTQTDGRGGKAVGYRGRLEASESEGAADFMDSFQRETSWLALFFTSSGPFLAS